MTFNLYAHLAVKLIYMRRNSLQIVTLSMKQAQILIIFLLLKLFYCRNIQDGDRIKRSVSTCGTSSSILGFSGLVLRGSDVNRGEFPW